MRATTVAAVALASVGRVAAGDLTYADLASRIPSYSKIPGLQKIEADIYAPTTDPFVLDLNKTNFVWTTAVCKADSDGDGQTNGQEVGDPCCSWVETNNTFSNIVSDPGNASSTINLAMYSSIQCTKSEEAVAAAGKRRPKTRTPKPSTVRPTPTYEGGSGGPGSGAAIRKASGQQSQGNQTTTSASHKVVSTASAVAVVLSAVWALL